MIFEDIEVTTPELCALEGLGEEDVGAVVQEDMDVTTQDVCIPEVPCEQDVGECDVLIDNVGDGDDRLKFIKEVEQDESLSVCKWLASVKERGYKWSNGLLLHCVVDCTMGEVERIVVPRNRRMLLCELAHDKSGHLRTRKVKK